MGEINDIFKQIEEHGESVAEAASSVAEFCMPNPKRPPAPNNTQPTQFIEKDNNAADAELFAHFEANAAVYCERLAEFVGIPSVSADPERRPDVRRAITWFDDWCKALGAHTVQKELGDQTLSDGLVIGLPPVLLAEFGADPAKKTMVIYGHLDVQPAAVSDGWDTDPFVLTDKSGVMYGRGATDDKGPTTAWLWVIEAHQKLGRELPVNLRCVFEGMEESGSVGLPDLVYGLAKPGGAAWSVNPNPTAL